MAKQDNLVESERKPICECGKVGFDKKTAQTKANWLMKNKGKRLRIYQCDISDYWHLTSVIQKY